MRVTPEAWQLVGVYIHSYKRSGCLVHSLPNTLRNTPIVLTTLYLSRCLVTSSSEVHGGCSALILNLSPTYLSTDWCEVRPCSCADLSMLDTHLTRKKHHHTRNSNHSIKIIQWNLSITGGRTRERVRKVF